MFVSENSLSLFPFVPRAQVLTSSRTAPHHGLRMFRKKGTDIALPQITLVIRPIKQHTDAKYFQRSGFVYDKGCNK